MGGSAAETDVYFPFYFQGVLHHHAYILSLKNKSFSYVWLPDFSRNFQTLVVPPLYLCLYHKPSKSAPGGRQSGFLAIPGRENGSLSVVCWTPAVFTEGALTSVRPRWCTVPAGLAARIRAETYSDSFFSQIISCVCVAADWKCGSCQDQRTHSENTAAMCDCPGWC